MEKQSQNLQKYKSKNPVVILLLNNFYKEINLILRDLEKPKRVLDAACGEGFAVQKIGNMLAGADIFGLDKSEDVLNIAKSVAVQMTTKKGRIENIPFESNKFDLVFALEILEHLKNPEQGLKEINRVCKKYCIISVPNEPWFSWCNVIRLKNVKRLGRNKEHVNFWGKKEIVELVGKHFKIKKIRAPFPWTIILCKK